ncbi:MAG: mechanosensitive ion channel domain-containing protein, partial [Bacteroidota bacterium]
MDWQEKISELTSKALEYAPKILLGLVVIIIGFWIANRIAKLVTKGLKKRDADEALVSFLTDLVKILLKAVVVISAAGIVGIQTTSFVAILGAAGLAVGLALQGSLANFAGGVLILLFKPFRVGDLIDAQGFIGHVRAINVFVTTLESPDSKTVVIPNGPLSNGSVTNLSTLGKLRVDLVVGIGYGEDIQKARNAIMEVMKNDPKVMQDPAPSVNVLELGDSSVNLAVRPYATPADYWDVY